MRLSLVFGALAVAATLAGCGSPAAPTPSHVTAEFVDGLNHADYRETCSTWLAGRANMADCEAQVSFLVAAGGFPTGWRVAPHSYTGWRVGRSEFARVEIVNPYAGPSATSWVLLRKVRGAWYVWLMERQ